MPVAEIVQTSGGLVRGVVERGVRRFLGVPYAAPPVGDDRFAPPHPHPPWTGVFDASSWGAAPAQTRYRGRLAEILTTVLIAGDEILNLNIWTPNEPSAGAGYPVMIWLHGGALTHGSNALQTYDGHAFARDGVILVSPNYRLGTEGFAVLDDAPANLGLADQAAALGWVRDNIASFGGDPRRVTLSGQSAGGGCVAVLLASPATAGLFSQAIVQSGPLLPAQPGRERRTTELIAADLGVATTRAAFAAVPTDQLLASQAKVLAGAAPLSRDAGFGPVSGDELVPIEPAVALAAGAGAPVPVVLGHTSEEYRLWCATGLLGQITQRSLFEARRRLGIPRRAIRVYRQRLPEAATDEIFCSLATDLRMRRPKYELADVRLRHGGRSWMYEFGWRSPVLDLGAAHGMELGFVFDTLETESVEKVVGPNRPPALAEEMHRAWVRFAASGDPGWPEWDASRPVMRFDAPHSSVVFDPWHDEDRALDGTG